MEAPLADVRILDLSHYEAGPSCTQLLALLGADVVKVEPPGGGDPGRALGRRKGTWDSIYFLLLNSAKRSVTLDLRQPEGRDILLRLLPRFDVLIENFSLGTLADMGLEEAMLRERHPALVLARIKGFGLSGPYAGYRAFDMIAQAMGGSTGATGVADEPPMTPASTVGDTGTGLHAAIGILAALRRRDRTGHGATVELSMQEAVVNLTRLPLWPAIATGEAAPRNSLESGIPGGGLYPCRPFGPNDWVYVLPMTDTMWATLATAIGRAELAADAAFATRRARRERPAEVRAAVAAACAVRTKQEVLDLLAPEGVPCGAVLDAAEILADPHMRERGFIVEVEHPERGTLAMPTSPIVIDGQRGETLPAPLLGADNASIYGELLGWNEADLRRAAAQGLI